MNGWHRKQPSTAEANRRREYDTPEYRRTRANLGRQVAAGLACCWRCGCPLPPGSKWHTGHDDFDRRVIRGTECPPCNLRTAASRGARIANATRKAKRLGVTAVPM